MTVEENLIEYFKFLGLDVHTTTKARGHLGFFLNGRIDISKNVPPEKAVPTLLHEFAHYIHSKIEENILKTGGSLNKLFDTDEDFTAELLAVTNFVDKNSKCEKLLKHREMVKNSIKKLDSQIKEEFPKFQRSKKFKEFDRAIRGTKLKYLLKYDRVRIMPFFLFGKEEVLSVNTVEKDFPNLKKAFVSYIRLKSLTRKQRRITNRIAKLKRYYLRPTELFARFTEALYTDNETVKNIAPHAYEKFYQLLENGYYKELKYVFENIL